MTRALPFAGLALLLVLPYSTVDIPGVFEGPLNGPGTLQLLALCLVFAGVATGYDLLFGQAGLLSFGHALYLATGVYGTVLLVDRTHLSLAAVVPMVLLGGTLLALLSGAVALRTSGIAFAMVTLAFAQVGAIVVRLDPGGLTGGEEGRPLDGDRLPGTLLGVANTVNLYWIAVAYLVLTVAITHRAAASPTGRVWRALRDDERRVAVLGLSPYRYKLLAFTVSGALATAGGVCYALLVGGASAEVTASTVTLSLLVMVVLGGPGTRWGPLAGGVLYTYLDHRLTGLADSPTLAHLPTVLREPLSQPLFVLGTVFVLAVFFFPGGLAALSARIGPVARRRGPSTADGGDPRPHAAP